MKKIMLGLSVLLLAIILVACENDDVPPVLDTYYTVTFNTDGGTSVTTEKVKSGDKATRPNDPTKTDHTFDGWYLNDIIYDFDKFISSDIVLKAKWSKVLEEIKYTISFDSDGGTNVPNQNVNSGETIKEPKEPTKELYEFSGWYLDDIIYDFSDPVTENMTLTAKWLKLITNITYDDIKVKYDGQIKELVLKGDISEFNVVYKNNKAKDVGIYESEVIISADGYKTLILNATLTIEKANLNIELDNEYVYTGSNIELTFTGDIPNEVTKEIIIKNSEGKIVTNLIDKGEYTVRIIFTSDNYETFIIEDTINVKESIIKSAKEIIDKLLDLPDPWEILPNSFSKENRLIETVPNFNHFNTINSFSNLNGMSQQLATIYNTLNNAELGLTAINMVTSLQLLITESYQNHISNGNDSNEFSKEEGNIEYLIKLDVKTYTMNAKVKLPLLPDKVSVLFNYDLELDVQTVIINIMDGIQIKLVKEGSNVKLAVLLIGTFTYMLEYETNDDGIIVGWVFANTKIPIINTNLTTKSFFEINKDYTIVVGTDSDFASQRKGIIVEVYENKNASLIGMEIKDVYKIGPVEATYNTIWYNLGDMSGINNIKAVLKEGLNIKPGENNYNIYINNSDDTFKTKNMGGLSSKALSRKYDIEMRKMFYYIIEDEKIKEIDVQIPMLFVQAEGLKDYISDIKKENKLTNLENNIIERNQQEIIDSYDKMIVSGFYDEKETDLTLEKVNEFLGLK